MATLSPVRLKGAHLMKDPNDETPTVILLLIVGVALGAVLAIAARFWNFAHGC